MDLARQYQLQNKWRNWAAFIDKLPLKSKDIILDLGCGLGFTTRLISRKVNYVFGLDNNPELINYAKHHNSAGNIQYIKQDIRSLDTAKLPLSDGIWLSYVTAYFPDLSEVLHHWIKFLKTGGWIALTEITDLFGHEPLDKEIRKIINRYYLRQTANSTYDFEMGKKLKGYLINLGLSVFHEEERGDPELSFKGPASEEILRSWKFRFERMYKFKQYLGENSFLDFKQKFLECLSDDDHISIAKVKFIIAVKK